IADRYERPQLLQRGAADAGHLEQFVHAAKTAVLLAVLLDALGQRRPDAGELAQLRPSGFVQIDAVGEGNGHVAGGRLARADRGQDLDPEQRGETADHERRGQLGAARPGGDNVGGAYGSSRGNGQRRRRDGGRRGCRDWAGEGWGVHGFSAVGPRSEYSAL